MKISVMMFIFLMIAPLMSISNSIYQTIIGDTVRVPIEYIRIANQVFVDRDRLEVELSMCKKISSIQAVIVDSSDSIINKLETNITNLNLIISAKENIHNTEIGILEDRLDKSRKFNIIAGSVSAIFIALLIIL